MRVSTFPVLLLAISPTLIPALELSATPVKLILKTDGNSCAELVWAAQRSLPQNFVSLLRLFGYEYFDFSPCWNFFNSGNRTDDLNEASDMIDRIIAIGGRSVLRRLVPLSALQRMSFGFELLERHLSKGDFSFTDYPLDELKASFLMLNHAGTFLPLLKRRSVAIIESPEVCDCLLSFGTLEILKVDDLWSLIGADCIKRAVNRAKWFRQQNLDLVHALHAAVHSEGPLADLAFYRLMVLKQWAFDSELQSICKNWLTTLAVAPNKLRAAILVLFTRDQESAARQEAFMYIREHMQVPASLQSAFILEHLLMALYLSISLDSIIAILRKTLTIFGPEQVPAPLVRTILGEIDSRGHEVLGELRLLPSWGKIRDSPGRVAAYFPEAQLNPKERLDCWRRRNLRLPGVTYFGFISGDTTEHLPTSFLGEADTQVEMMVSSEIEREGRIVVIGPGMTLQLDCSRQHRERLATWWRGRLLRLLINLEPLPDLSEDLRKAFNLARTVRPPALLGVGNLGGICIRDQENDHVPTAADLSLLIHDLFKSGARLLRVISL